MSRYRIRFIASAFLLTFVICTTGWAQIQVEYHIWNEKKVGSPAPNWSTTERYFESISQSQPTSDTVPQGMASWLEDNIETNYGTFGYEYAPANDIKEYQVNLVLHNDDNTLNANYGGPITVSSPNILVTTSEIDPVTGEFVQEYLPTHPIVVRSDTEGVKRTLGSVNSALFDVSTAGAAAYDPENPPVLHPTALTITKDVIISEVNSTEQYGAIRINSAILNARDVTFQFNTISGNTGFGGAIYALNSSNGELRSTINVERARFYKNQANQGGAVSISNSDLYADGARFEMNVAAGLGSQGGALYLINNATASLQNASFIHNTATQGGAIYAINSELDLKGAEFLNNTATSGPGGAIYFNISDNNNHELKIGAFEGKEASFSGNTHMNLGTGTLESNSITFGSASTNSGMAFMTVEVDGAANNLNMDDPMALSGNGRLTLEISKTGKGSWNLSENNRLGGTLGGTRFNINEGTFRLNEGASLTTENTSLTDDLRTDHLKIYSGATLAVGSPLNPSTAGATIQTTMFSAARGSTIRLDKNLTITTEGSESRIAGTLTGSGSLTKRGGGTLAFTGQTTNYTGDLVLQGGTFMVNSTDHSFETTGTVTFGGASTLATTVNAYRPNIVADGFVFQAGSSFDISGVYGESDVYVILDSKTPLTGGFTNSPNPAVNSTDYLTADFDIFNDPVEGIYRYQGSIVLSWDLPTPTMPGDPAPHGDFTIEPVSGYFKVGKVLEDRSADYDPSWGNWTGSTLTKKGRGTLELAEANQYQGNTYVEKGTLLLTNRLGTGGQGEVILSDGASLVLDFDDETAAFGQRITDEMNNTTGQVVKDGTGTVILGNAGNDYQGGTVIKDGVLAIDSAAALGSGLITFDGGTLRNLVPMTQAGSELSQNILIQDGKEAVFDTQVVNNVANDLVLTGNIFDPENKTDIDGNLQTAYSGGLRKTGGAKLTLAGNASYKGATTVEAGTLSVSESLNLGLGDLVLHDGATFETTGSFENTRKIVLLPAEAGSTVGAVLDIVTAANEQGLLQSGVVTGDGRLVKAGEGELTLTGFNDFSGGLQLSEGILAFSRTESLGTGDIIFDGGLLKNTTRTALRNENMTVTTGNNFRFDTPENLHVASRLWGTGGLDKTGSAALILTGDSIYTGNTRIHEGTFTVNGSIQSKTTVADGATLTGTGTIYNHVTFESGSTYRWTFDLFEERSPYLTVSGKVVLEDGVVFQPVTAGTSENYADSMEGWTVLRYAETLDGKFAEIDNSLSPFYDFELDYSTPNRVKIVGHHRRNPRALSDSVATGLVMAQRKVYRRAFDQVDMELRDGRRAGASQLRDQRLKLRGQAAGNAPHIWGSMYGRTSKYDSTYHSKAWKLNSFGIQAGYSFLSSPWRSMGVTFGAEFPELKGSRDKVEATDGYLGLYYGQRIYGLWELKGYIGGGTQKYKSYRNDTKYTYRAKYRGESFESNLELARPFMLGEMVVRPHIGFDLEYATQQSSVENVPGDWSEHRTYSGASLTQLYVRIGLDVDRQYERGNTYLGVSYSNMIGGQSTPHVYVYYPAAKAGVTSYGKNLGQNIFTIRGGGNLNVRGSRDRNIFLNVTADVFADRGSGRAAVSFDLGYDYRF